MPNIPHGTRRFLLLSLALAAAVAAGCASSTGEKSSSSTRDDSSNQTQSSTDDEASGSTSSSEEETSKKTVELVSIVGNETTDGMPEGCPEAWNKLEDRDYDGTVYACNGFQAPERFKEPTVIIGVRDNVVRRVTLQAFYDSGKPIEKAYRNTTDRYQQKCDVEGTGGGSMVLRCDGYVAQVSHRDRGGSLRIVLGLKSWDLPN